jgi:hypothetical protein
MNPFLRFQRLHRQLPACSVLSSDLIKLVLKWPDFLDTFRMGYLQLLQPAISQMEAVRQGMSICDKVVPGLPCV